MHKIGYTILKQIPEKNNKSFEENETNKVKKTFKLSFLFLNTFFIWKILNKTQKSCTIIVRNFYFFV